MTARLEVDGFREPFGERVLAAGFGGTRREDAADGGGRREDAGEGGGRSEDDVDRGGLREPPLGRGEYLPSVGDAIDCDD